MVFIECVGKTVGFLLSVFIFTLIISFIRGVFTISVMATFFVSTGFVVFVFAWLFSIEGKRKVEDVS